MPIQIHLLEDWKLGGRHAEQDLQHVYIHLCVRMRYSQEIDEELN
jgi:hypothetical protein